MRELVGAVFPIEEWGLAYVDQWVAGLFVLCSWHNFYVILFLLFYMMTVFYLYDDGIFTLQISRLRANAHSF